MYQDLKLIATLGKWTVSQQYEYRKTYEYAAAFTDLKIYPQTTDIELVNRNDSHGKFIRVVLKGTIINSSMPEHIGKDGEYWIYSSSTYCFANYVQNGIQTGITSAELNSDYKIIQCSDSDGKLSFYHDGSPMIRIVKIDGSPICVRSSYWVNNKIWNEMFL